MEIEKILGIGIVAVVLAVMLKSYRPEFALMSSIISVGIIFALISPYLKTVMASFVDLSEKIGVDIQYIIIVIKVIGIAYVAQIGSEICRDAGENAIGSKIEIAGKVIITAMSMPVIYKLLEVVTEVINFT